MADPVNAPSAMAAPQGATCRGCRHLIITHNASRPYGCRVFGLMSRRHPAQDILAHSGEPCRARTAFTVPFSLDGGQR